MQRSFIEFHRKGKQLHTSKLNGFPLVTFGMPVGSLHGVDCFESVTVSTGGRRERVVTEEDLGGPVSICVITKGQPPKWFGLADRIGNQLKSCDQVENSRRTLGQNRHNEITLAAAV